MTSKTDASTLPAWLENTLLDDGFLQKKLSGLRKEARAGNALEDWLKEHFDANHLSHTNEAQLESELIAPLLEKLGWNIVPQQVITVQGKLAKPDWCLALDAVGKQSIIQLDRHEAIRAICEAKAWGKPLDTGKAKREENPHHQLQDYLSTLRIRFGFLTNGRFWRFYDTDRITAQKTYVQFDLAQIVSQDDADEKRAALLLFSSFFSQQAHLRPAQGGESQSLVEQTIVESSDFTLEVEENLKAVIYGVDGEDSLFELMGKAIHKANSKHKPTLAAVYENSVILLFRLLFVVYFEDKNRQLLDAHPFYRQHSLGSLYQRLRSAEKRDALHDGFYALKHLFEILDEGAEDIDIPLFNGGLFDPQRAPFLRTPKIFTNAQLRAILEKLLFKTHRGTTLFDTRRDFKNMSVSHLGRIYEGLLEFRFEEAQEDAVYLEYTAAGSKAPVEAYFDSYDAALIKKQKGFVALREIPIRKGSLYLKSTGNSRKATASYYTPSSLSRRLVDAGITNALENARAQGRELADIKILDNACGSGHFLVESLNRLTDVALERLEGDSALQSLLEGERRKIIEQLEFLSLPYEPDDAQILKRALLKRCIYGIDLNPFAVELARLSLWMDSFIFGTPLSFIEHHVQQGNALMGATIADFIAYNRTENTQHDLFVDNLQGRFDELVGVMRELDELRDTTSDEIERSKKLWKTQIAPRLNLLSRALSFISTRDVLKAEGKRKEVERLDKTLHLLDVLFDEGRGTKSGKNDLLKLVEGYSERFRFFHYEVAFPEAFAGGVKGFDVVIGNPPWDKTKFTDMDFFPQYHSNYRSLKNNDKKVVQKRLLQSDHIAAAYEAVTADMQVKNDYYLAKYPLNRGAGDGNLFRFFVERNLSLVASNGSLNYVLPSALMFEEGSQALREHILSNYRMRFFHSFENRKRLFADVDSRYKFALMQVVRGGQENSSSMIDAAFYVLDPSELDRAERRISYPLSTLKRLSPDQWAMMELRDERDLPILDKCYSAFPRMTESWLNFRRELDMTNDKDLFQEKAKVGSLPLYEGKMLWQYNHRFEQAQYWLDVNAFDERLTSKELHRMAQDLGIGRLEAAKHVNAIRFDREFIRLGFRDIARDTDERTLVFALLPTDCGVGNTVNISVPKNYVLQSDGTVGIDPVSPLRLLFALAWFNSLPVDWMARFMIQIHANKTYLYRLPVPQPTDSEIQSNPEYLKLVKNAAQLTLSEDWDAFKALATPLGIKNADVPDNDKARDKLRAENDRRVARLYGITDEQFAHLLGSFKVMAGKRPEYLALLKSA